MATEEQVTVLVADESRYKTTPAFDSDRGAEYGLMRVLDDFIDLTSHITHRVDKAEIGFLDILAARYYGRGRESLWWVIALANAIIDMEMEMFEGQILIIPTRAAVTAFINQDQVVA